MVDLLQKASEWLENKRTQFAACMVTYVRGNQTASVPATIGKTVFEIEDGYGLIIRHESRDFLILAADLVLGGVKTLPQKGDHICETQGDTVYIHEIVAFDKEGCWRFSDLFRKTLRIHTKKIGEEKVSDETENPILTPIGSIMAWLKNFQNTPALPTGWVECNGQVLNDSESVYNGRTLPDLNGDHRFLRGDATTGGQGGEETHRLIIEEIPSHGHSTGIYDIPGSGPGVAGNCGYDDYNGAIIGTEVVGGDQPHNNLPPYYNVVWIMRVK